MQKLVNIYHSINYHEKIMILISFMGMIPFIIGLLDLWFNQENLIFSINFVKYYGVIILTFLGSIYWGIILNQNKTITFSNQFKILIIIWSITPAFGGTLILLIDKDISLIILSIGYLICQIIDEIYNKFLFFPNWYILLRRLLSFTVITILVSCYLILKH
ncbi:MAG: DUF3429 domain-containing protein [Candidatus Puniceispirillales bacterium]|jgi:hypothetical protein|tara:strand:+ start:89 stop:571 length:483 start_codon:yes stop_codon:yes gene_type:complete